MILEMLRIAIQLGGTGAFLLVGIGIYDYATTPGQSDWYEDRREP